MRGTIRQRRTRCNFYIREADTEVSAHLVPRSDGGVLVDQGPHDGVYDEPCRKYDDEPDQDIGEYLPRGAHIPAATRSDVFPSRPCEKYRGEEDRDKDTRVEDILRQRRDIAQSACGLAGASALNDPRRQSSCGGSECRDSDENDRNDYEKPDCPFLYHTNIVACTEIRHTVPAAPMAERSNARDCRSRDFGLRGFESLSAHK